MITSQKSISNIIKSNGITFDGEMLNFPSQGAFNDLFSALVREEQKGKQQGRAIAASFEKAFSGFHSQDAELERLYAEAESKGGFSDKSDPCLRFLPGWMLRATLNAAGCVRIEGKTLELSLEGTKVLNEKGKWELLKAPERTEPVTKSSPNCWTWAGVRTQNQVYGNNLRRLTGRIAVVPMILGKLWTTETIHSRRNTASSNWQRTSADWISASANILYHYVGTQVTLPLNLFNSRDNAGQVSDGFLTPGGPQVARGFVGLHQAAGAPTVWTDIC